MNRQRDEPATFVSKYHTLTHPPQRVSPGFTSPHSVRLVGSMSSVSVALNVSAHDRNVACGAKGGLPGLLQSVAVNSLNCDTITNLGRGSAMAARICINSVEPCRKRPFLLHFPTRTYSHPQPVWSNNRSHQKPACKLNLQAFSGPGAAVGTPVPASRQGMCNSRHLLACGRRPV